jgi:LuxR family transcriptional regulator, maltose regulon positive regulatory protein
MVTSAATPAAGGSARQAAGAGDPLLASKITVPGVPGWLVPRPRLDKLIARGARGPMTIVTGPPGAGKTMALALWAAATPPAGPLAWVTIDDYDNRPRVFWSYVVAALRRSGVSIPRGMSATMRRYVVDHEFLLRFASLMAEQDPPVTLVLDDVHLLAGPKVLDGLAYVLRHAAPGLRLVASSRIDPLLPLHRYRLTGELAEVRAGDLAFNIPESRLLLAQHDVTLLPESLERLTGRAEGWAAVMRLAAISMDGHGDPEQFVKELLAEDSAVAGYLVEEVLNAQPAHVRDFLLRTSILDRINDDIAAGLSDDPHDTPVLADLAQANAFVQRDGSGLYRYHSLFAEVLRLKLRRDDPDLVPELHLRAARWYRRSGAFPDAIGHAAAAGDWQLAARTVLDGLVVNQLIEPRGSELLARAFDHMPRHLEWSDPQPLLVAAAIDFARSWEGTSQARLSAAERLLEQLPAGDEVPTRLAAAQIGLALSRRDGDLDAARAAASAAQVLVDELPRDRFARRPAVQVQALAGRGAVALWSGDFDAAAASFEAGVAVARTPDSDGERAECLGHLALLEALRGRLDRAAELAAEAATGPEDDMDHPVRPVSLAAEIALACVHLERNELARARRWQKRAQDALRARPDKLLGAAACMVAARQSLAEGRGRAAAESAGRARRGWSPPAWIEHRLLILDSWAAAAAGDFQSAIDVARRADPGSSLGATVALARALVAGGDPRAARHALLGAPTSGQASDSERVAAWLIDAQLSFGIGDHPEGRRALEHALRLAEPEQLRLPFAMERSWIKPVLRHDHELAHPYRHVLQPDLISPPRDEARLSDAGRPVPLIVEPLSEREREVLEHVSALESTAEIATEMYISVNTVKTHLKSIYRKLSATHRGEAVRHARQFGLL